MKWIYRRWDSMSQHRRLEKAKSRSRGGPEAPTRKIGKRRLAVQSSQSGIWASWGYVLGKGDPDARYWLNSS